MSARTIGKFGTLERQAQYNAQNQLCVNGTPVIDIAKQFGTPTYVYNLATVADNFNRIRSHFNEAIERDISHHQKDNAATAAKNTSVEIHYSMKANPSFAVLKTLKDLGSGVDCVSGGEVFKALKAGVSPKHIVFAGVGKSREELHFAITSGVEWINVENAAELALVEEVAGAIFEGDLAKMRDSVKVALRLNPDVMANTHHYIATGHGSAKFGMTEDTIREILRTAHERKVSVSGIHAHIGSQLGDVSATEKAVDKILAILSEPTTNKITHVNIGGGFPAYYTQADSHLPPPSAFADAIVPRLRGYQIQLEPGRSVVGEAGMLLTTSLYRKEQGGQRILVVDASMVELIRPALYQAHHEVVPAELSETRPVTGSPMTEEEKAKSNLLSFTIAGPVCESADVLCRNVMLTDCEAQSEKIFAHLTAGAYCSSMAGNYNARRLAAEVAVLPNGEVKEARRRQTMEDLVRDEMF